MARHGRRARGGTQPLGQPELADAVLDPYPRQQRSDAFPRLDAYPLPIDGQKIVWPPTVAAGPRWSREWPLFWPLLSQGSDSFH
jgi:hypothetical protein